MKEKDDASSNLLHSLFFLNPWLRVLGEIDVIVVGCLCCCSCPLPRNLRTVRVLALPWICACALALALPSENKGADVAMQEERLRWLTEPRAIPKGDSLVALITGQSTTIEDLCVFFSLSRCFFLLCVYMLSLLTSRGVHSRSPRLVASLIVSSFTHASSYVCPLLPLQ